MAYYMKNCGRCKKETKHLVYKKVGDKVKLKCVNCRRVCLKEKNLHEIKHSKFKEKKNLGPIKSLLLHYEELFKKK